MPPSRSSAHEDAQKLLDAVVMAIACMNTIE
jgi:hypothetical protein